MFRNQTGNLCTNAETIAERIKGASDEEVEAMEKRKVILHKGLDSLSARVQSLPERERNAAFSLLYKELTDIVSSFHFSLEVSASREKYRNAMTHEEKEEALRELRTRFQDWAMLYDIV